MGGQHQVGLDRAEVGGRRPDPDRGLGEGFRQVDDLDHHRRLLADARVALGPLAQALEHHDEVRLQRHFEQHVGPAAAVAGIVQDHVAEHLAVGDHHLDVVGGGDLGEQQVQGLHRALARHRLDIVAHAVGPEQQDHHPRRDVREGALQGQADGQRRRAQHRDDRGGLHAQLLQHRHQADGDHRIAHQRGAEALQGRVGIVPMHPAQAPADDPRRPASYPEGDQQDQGGDHQVYRQLAQPVQEMSEHGLVGLHVGKRRQGRIRRDDAGLGLHGVLDRRPRHVRSTTRRARGSA